MTPARHVAALCAELDITRVIAPGRGRANVRTRTIKHPPIRTEMAYFVALHEIAHIIRGLEGKRLEREAWCWDWAIRNAIVRPDFSTRQRICACLVRYLIRAPGRGWAIPRRSSRFWDLLVWWA